MRETAFGTMHPATLRLAFKFGRYLRNNGELEEGTKMQKRAVDGWRAAGAFGSETRLSIAETLARQGRLDGDFVYSEKLLRDLIPVSERLRGTEHRETLGLRSDLALVIGSIGNFAEAERIDRELIEVRKRALGPDDRDVAASMNNAAVQLANQGKYKESLAMYEDAYAFRLKTGKEDDVEALRTRSSIAAQFISLGRYHEAMPIVNTVLEGRMKKLGAKSRDAIYSKGQLAGLLFAKGDANSAETMAREYVDDTVTILGREAPSARGARSLLAGILIEKGDVATALATARELSEWHAKHPDGDRPGKIDSDILLGEALSKSGDYAKARPLLLEAVRAQEELSGPTDLGTLRGKLLVARMYINTNEAKAGEPILRGIIDTAAAKLDTDHPLIAEAGIELAELLEKSGNKDEASTLKARAREIVGKKLLPESPLRKRCEK
jgi:tetratricopeptide (TPR) repeat protein